MSAFNFGMAGATTGVQNAPLQAQAAPAVTPEAIYGAAVRCNVFGDDRDTLLARWNLLQASWGTGRIYSAKSTPPLPVDQTNPNCQVQGHRLQSVARPT